jgi:hypothetical protein
MPIITSQDRPVPVADESAYRAPKKIINASTGMDLKQSVSGAPQDQNRQQQQVVETPATREVTLSPQMTALARKESKVRQQELAIKAERAAIDAEKAEIASLKQAKTKLAAKDYSILAELGVDYNDYSNYLIAQLNEQDPAQAAIKALEQKVNSFEEGQKAQVSKQYEATINQYKRDIKNAVESNPEFDSIKAQGAEEHVLQHILDTFNEDGEILTVEQAAKEVEAAILEEAEEYLKLSKIQSKLKPKVEEKILPPPRQGLKTLTNQVTQAAPSSPRNQFQHLSPKERLAQAIARANKQ